MIRTTRLAAASIVLPALLSLTPCGCAPQAPPAAKPQYPTVPNRPVPSYMEGTLYQTTDLQNDNPFLVSGWGLVVNLEGTGGSHDLPNNVKAYMVKEMEKRGFGSKLVPGFSNIQPEMILNDKKAAIVAVYGWIPPGARKGQWFDVAVKAGDPNVASLARGTLYDTDLTIDGADPVDPSKRVNVFATAYGPVFVNPAAALVSSENPGPATRRSLRTASIIGGGQVMFDRPLLLRLRQPQNRLSRAIERRVNEFFHRDKVATAYDQAFCQLWVPPEFAGDWEHFSKLVMHLYLQGNSEAFARAKARELVSEARKPGAALQDISYCWEGLGGNALPALAPLLSDSAADVRFAAARAAAYIGDPSGAAEQTLYDLARTEGPFQLAAVQVLGRIPNSRAVNHLLRDLLDCDQTTVRIEAYNILARANDPSIVSQVICSARESASQKFVLDMVPSRGEPLIYATRSGLPRIAIIGDVPQLAIPLTFGAMNDHLTISSGQIGRDVTIYYRQYGSLERDVNLAAPVQMSSPPDLADIVVRLAGQVDDGSGQLDFTYAEVLAILQGLSDQHKLRVTRPTGEAVAAAFVLQDAPAVRDAIDGAAPLDRGRPQGDVAVPPGDAIPPVQGNPPRRENGLPRQSAVNTPDVVARN